MLSAPAREMAALNASWVFRVQRLGSMAMATSLAVGQRHRYKKPDGLALKNHTRVCRGWLPRSPSQIPATLFHDPSGHALAARSFEVEAIGP